MSSEDKQLNIEQEPTNTKGKWSPKYNPQSEMTINSCLWLGTISGHYRHINSWTYKTPRQTLDNSKTSIPTLVTPWPNQNLKKTEILKVRAWQLSIHWMESVYGGKQNWLYILMMEGTRNKSLFWISLCSNWPSIGSYYCVKLSITLSHSTTALLMAFCSLCLLPKLHRIRKVFSIRKVFRPLDIFFTLQPYSKIV